MVSLKEGRGKTITWVFAALGFAAGFLVYDALASSRTLNNSDCEQLAPYVSDFFSETEKFISKDPPKWHRVEKFYAALFEELIKYSPRTDEMKKQGEDLRSAVDTVARSIYGFNPNARNRERLAEAKAKMKAQLSTLREVCR